MKKNNYWYYKLKKLKRDIKKITTLNYQSKKEKKKYHKGDEGQLVGEFWE